VLFVVAPVLDRTRPSLGAMDAFFSLGVLDEATRRVAFVQQISSSVTGPIVKVQTMPAEPILRPARDTAANAAAGRRPGARVPRSAR
jgi:hypothetical protein